MTKRSGIKQAQEENQADLFGGAPSRPSSNKNSQPARRAGPSAQAAKTVVKPSLSSTAPHALLNVREAAARLGLSKSTVDKMRGAGKGPKFIKSTDRAVRYDPKDLDAWIEARRRSSTSAT